MFVVLSFLLIQIPSETATTAVLEAIYRLDFKSAETSIEMVQARSPTHPRGYFLSVTSTFYQILARYPGAIPVDDFIALHDSIFDQCDRLEVSSPEEALFYRGAANGNLARYYAMNGDFFKAFRAAKKAKSIHTELLAKNPKWVDANLSIGMYNYYAAAAPKFIDAIASILGLGGNRAEGIRQLERVAQNGIFFSVESKFFLAHVYSEEGQYEKALVLFEELIQRYPDNPFLKNQLGMAQFFSENYNAAEDNFLQAASESESAPAAKFTALYFLGRLNKLRGNFISAEAHLKNAVQLGESIKLYKYIDGWMLDAAQFQIAETLEMSGRRTDSEVYYKKATQAMYSARTQKSARMRLDSPLSDFEIQLMIARHSILLGQNEQGILDLLRLKKKISGGEKFVSQIDHYLGRACFQQRRYSEAASYLALSISEAGQEKDEAYRVAQTHYYLASAMKSMTQYSASRNHIQKILDLPDEREFIRLKVLANTLLDEVKDK